eukprot:6186253-Pleurochrysis_carterae.AAC.2
MLRSAVATKVSCFMPEFHWVSMYHRNIREYLYQCNPEAYISGQGLITNKSFLAAVPPSASQLRGVAVHEQAKTPLNSPRGEAVKRCNPQVRYAAHNIVLIGADELGPV